MNSTLFFVIDTLQWILLCYFLFSALYYFIFAIAGTFPYKIKYSSAGSFNKIAVLIPAYKEDAVIISTSNEALMLDYPKEYFDVYVIADHLQKTTIEELKKTKVKVVEPNLIKSSKAKALFETMKQIPENKYEIVVILDADNQCEKNFLKKINDAFSSGNKIIQAHRTAKNLNSDFAILDAISEEINNHLFRKAHQNLGLASILIGSGMAFPFKLLLELIQNANTSFEDKEIEFMLLKKGMNIQYLHCTYVYDEKIQEHASFGKQRTRWIYSQLYFFRKFFFQSFLYFFKKHKRSLAFRSFETGLPPRVFQLVFPVLILLFDIFFETIKVIDLWLVVVIISATSLLISVPVKYYNKKTLKALLSLPLAFIMMLKATIQYKKAEKGFIHTQHTGAS